MNTKKIKVSDYLIQYIAKLGTTKIFGYIGGAITHIVDSIGKQNQIEMVNCIHEQGAGLAAEGYARISNNIGVTIATSGPGATNLITAIANCYFDSSSVVFITGQVNTYDLRKDERVRQRGFQEADIVKMVLPITKWAVQVNDEISIRYIIEKAFFIASQHRKGPVLIDIPMNIQRAEVNLDGIPSYFNSEEYKNIVDLWPKHENLNYIQTKLKKTKRPLVIIGGGVRLSGNCHLVSNWLKKTKLPFVYSLMGKDAVNEDVSINMGLIGSYGNRYGNLALANSDLIIALGTRLDSRQVGNRPDLFAREATIIQVDIDKNELGAQITPEVFVHSNLVHFMKEVLAWNYEFSELEWLHKLEQYKTKYPSTKTARDKKIKIANKIMEIISDNLQLNDIVIADVGQNQMWVAQTMKVNGAQRFLFSGGLGTMGFSLPCAIGSVIDKKARAIVISGDGGFQMNIQELEIIKRRDLPIKAIILNNYCLGMVREFQELYFESKYLSTVQDYSVPDFVNIAKAYQISAEAINSNDSIELLLEKITNFLADNKPRILEIRMQNGYTTIEPKLTIGKPIEDMYPFLDRAELIQEMVIAIADK